MGRNLDVQEKILQEIEHVCGTGENVGYNDFQKLPYLNSTFKEVMRMFSTAQLVIRKNAKDVVLGGYNVTSDVSFKINIKPCSEVEKIVCQDRIS